MVDRELLIRAARAIGWRVIAYSETGTNVVDGGTAVVVGNGRTFGWRPLTDNDDAAALAARCGITHGIGIGGRPRVAWSDEGQTHYRDMPEDHPEIVRVDELAWMRRAIVEVAATAPTT